MTSDAAHFQILFLPSLVFFSRAGNSYFKFPINLARGVELALPDMMTRQYRLARTSIPSVFGTSAYFLLDFPSPGRAVFPFCAAVVIPILPVQHFSAHTRVYL